MPRRPRGYLANYTYHIVQRGNNKEACFLEPQNYQFYLELWQEVATKNDVAVHAYCLMTNHIHFLVTPKTETGISKSMQAIGSRYAQYINKHYSRTGTMWEGRHRSSLVQNDRYLLACYRYIEMNPVRAGMVKDPGDYPWSSFLANAWGNESWLIPHSVYLGLSVDDESRLLQYRQLFQNDIPENDLALIRKAAHYGQPVGDDNFRAHIEQQYGLKLGQMRRGRPRR